MKIYIATLDKKPYQDLFHNVCFTDINEANRWLNNQVKPCMDCFREHVSNREEMYVSDENIAKFNKNKITGEEKPVIYVADTLPENLSGFYYDIDLYETGHTIKDTNKVSEIGKIRT